MFHRIATAAFLWAIAASCSAQDYPTRTITIVAPSAPGALSDVLARLIGKKVADTLSGTVIVEDKPGASGAIGSTYVMRAQPDGYTILLANGASHGALTALSKTPAYDPIKDFVPIARVGETQLALVVSDKLPVKNAQDFLTYARAHPGKLSYGSFGHGSAGHLFGEIMKKRNGIDMVHVPFKSEADAVQAILAGQIELAMLVSAKPYVDQGQVKLIGTTSPGANEAYPGWPTLTSQGVEGFSQARGFQAFLAPAGTPQIVVNKLADAISGAVADPEIRRQLLNLGVTPANETPKDFPALYRALVEQWRSIVRESGISTD
ncbi:MULTISPECIES: tripartite tricarboxylate transporter substrate binding protein [unclassified Beijerinckia]|uniref:Bug family tripartite tricarboxylate transporter substrate binding protein n=1 Tax=unclassified Beijerinckia TaxID=2638183 RepID=UPI0008991FE5|nr:MULTISPECIES: tripartite tricarboxylate transporter substrate binding protein [unclassified Beijerinckia]MDH7795665.1 tripartite-type tricarboxylate transporter receptor subunit TctC [Beijerinckia sp. GAS462]SEC11032.1 Tripartite-type tricarboxylate transporter, receptor component TctC [Beijerinckia sp. 28-YEA-48]